MEFAYMQRVLWFRIMFCMEEKWHLSILVMQFLVITSEVKSLVD